MIQGPSDGNELERSMYSAQVLKLDRGEHLIHCVGYDGSWDEWVNSKRIRRP